MCACKDQASKINNPQSEIPLFPASSSSHSLLLPWATEKATFAPGNLKLHPSSMRRIHLTLYREASFLEFRIYI